MENKKTTLSHSLMIRFPMATLMALSLCVTLLLDILFQPGGLNNISLNQDFIPFLRMLSKTFSLGIPLFITITMACEVYGKNIERVWFYILGVFMLGLYVLDILTRKSLVIDQILIQQDFILLISIFILSISFVPFFLFSMRSFWKFNNIMFVKILKTFIYGVILLSLFNGALFCVDQLLTVTIPFWCYQISFIVISSVFCVFFLLHSIPENLKQFESDTPFPTFYYLFSNGYLLPFCLISIVIFYLVVGWFVYLKQWPRLELTIIFSVVIGVSIYLALQYELLRSRTENFIIKKGLPLFYFSILPLCCIFIGTISIYWINNGITEFWYVILIYLLWTSFLCLYFISSKRKDIRFIPVSMAIVLIILLFSPLKPFLVGVNSQYSQLKKELKQVGVLAHSGKLVVGKNIVIPLENKIKILDHLTYLDEHQRLGLLVDIYPYSIAKQSLSRNRVLSDLGVSKD